MKEITDEQLHVMLLDSSTKEKGFRILMDRYQEKLYWHVRRIILDFDDTDDVVQNTFIKVFRNIHSFEGKSKLYTWLYRIATNEAITFKAQKQKKMADSIDNNPGLSNTLNADLYFEGDEIQRKLLLAIEELPEKQRIVFNLRYYDEMPYEEMSAVLDTSVGALKASYHHAAKKIEAFLKDE